MADQITRRGLMQRAFMTAAAGMLVPSPSGAQPGPAKVAADPFKLLGVASGDPWATGVVLWCRPALDLSDTDRWGLAADSYRVTWEVRAADQPKGRPVRSGIAIATRAKGYAVHVEVGGLQPGRPYSYTFRLGEFEASGLTRTAPAAHVMTQKLRFCFGSCAEYEYELYYAYDQMAAEKPDFIVWLGDYIYEETYDRYFKPGAPDPRARRLKFDRDQPLRTLAQYRRRYAEHKTDTMLQRAHAAAPWIATWDDHEVANDYAGGNSAIADEKDFVARRIAAYRAFFENMPIRLSVLPVREGRRQLYRNLNFGRLLNLSMLDERQYRDPQACRFDGKSGGKNIALADCPQLESNRSILGTAQERWIAAQLGASQSRWSVLAQGVMLAHLETRNEAKPKGRTDPHMWNDTWSGYLPARQRMIELAANHRAKNPIVLGGDIHSHFVNRVFRDWRKPGTDLVMPEFVTAAVSSFVRDLTSIVSDEANKDVVAFYDKSHHGYVSCEVTPEAFEATMVRIVDKDRTAGTCKTDRSARFRVENGNPEPKRVG